MILQMYSIYDAKAGGYARPFFAPNNAVAFRECESACRNTQAAFTQFPADYHLFRFGTFDEQSGKLESLPAPENLGTMLQFMPQTSPPAAAAA